MGRASFDRDHKEESSFDQQRDSEQASGSSGAESGAVASLHQMVGNQAVQENVRSTPSGTSGIRRYPERSSAIREAKREEKQGQGYRVNGTVATEIERAQGSGEPLDRGVRREMESVFGTDLSDVNVHTSGRANRLNRQVNAEAFTADRDIFFSQGSYEPDSSEGKDLLAHELTHVVTGSRVQSQIRRQESATSSVRTQESKPKRGGKQQERGGRATSEKRSRSADKNGVNNEQSSSRREQQEAGKKNTAGEKNGPVIKGETNRSKFEKDLRAAERHADDYLRRMNTAIDGMQTDYLRASKKIGEIMDLKDPKSVWETLGVKALEIAVAAAVGGPLASRLATSWGQGSFIAKGIEEGVKAVSNSLAEYGLGIEASPPGLPDGSAPLDRIQHANDINQKENKLKDDMFTEWEKAWEMRENPLRFEVTKDKNVIPPWNYNLERISKRMFQPITNASSPDFQKPFEKKLAEQAIMQETWGKTSYRWTPITGEQTTYDFYQPSLSYKSLKRLVRRIPELDVRDVAVLSKGLQGPIRPWNWYMIEPGDELYPE